MAKFSLTKFIKGWLKSSKRASSGNWAGWVDGSLTKNKRKAVAFEDGQIVCFGDWGDEFMIAKEEVLSVECIAQNVKVPHGDRSFVCNTFAVTLANGEFGTFNIFLGKVAEFNILLKKEV